MQSSPSLPRTTYTVRALNVRVESDPSSPVMATVDLVIDDAYIVRHVSLRRARGGAYIGWPAFKQPNGRWVRNYEPVLDDLRQAIEECILDAYKAHATTPAPVAIALS